MRFHATFYFIYGAIIHSRDIFLCHFAAFADMRWPHLRLPIFFCASLHAFHSLHGRTLPQDDDFLISLRDASRLLHQAERTPARLFAKYFHTAAASNAFGSLLPRRWIIDAASKKHDTYFSTSRLRARRAASASFLATPLRRRQPPFAPFYYRPPIGTIRAARAPPEKRNALHKQPSLEYAMAR